MKTLLNISLLALLILQVVYFGSIGLIVLLSIKFTIGLLVALNFSWLNSPVKKQTQYGN